MPSSANGAAAGASPVAPPAAERASILVVDDRPDKRLALATVLDDVGGDVVVAASGEEALKQVLAREFAVILLDVNMPGLDGLETAELIRGRRKSAHTPIIFITADFNDDAHTSRGYRLGAVDYIASPVMPEVLRAKVKVFVDLFLLAKAAERRALEHLALAEERAARAAAERTTQRLAFLARASAVLAGSLDVEATMREVGRLVVPQLADASLLVPVEVEGEARPAPQLSLRNGGEVSVAPIGEALPALVDSVVRDVAANGQAARLPREGSGEQPIVLPMGVVAHSAVVLPLAAGGRVLAVLVLGMTAERRFEADVQSLASDVAGRAAVALDNALLYHRIHESDQRKNEFIAMLAHELRNPLAPIANAVHILRMGEHDPATLEWAREVIGRQVGQLTRLVDDLLDLSRITRGKIKLQLEAVDAGAVVAAAVETCRPLIDALEHEVEIALPKAPVAVNADYARLAQILGNLVNNAAKYTDRGGRIGVSVAREGDEAVFRVRDNGIGIPSAALASIFEPFMQLERTLDRAQGGLGIGLTLVRRLVELQEGSVAAHSAGSGSGSEFVVRLPALEPATLEPGERAQPDARSGNAATPVRVLVVDDNADVAESTAILLRVAGCEVHIAGDGHAALDAVERIHPDAVLLDIGLPGMDGYQVAERMRARPDLERTLIVAVSGYGQDEYQARSRDAGVDHHLVKPIDPRAVMQLLATRLAGRVAPPEARTIAPS